jgi:sirohydrochlorin cobaltochelatase
MNLRRRSLLLLLVVVFMLPALACADSEVGVLIMAHGGTSQWNKTVKEAVRNAELPVPYRVFFGMGANVKELKELQSNVHWLEGKGAHTIVVVPLLVSGYSEVYRQWKYLLGVDVQPGFINVPLFPVKRQSGVRFMEPLNDSALVVEILLDRAQEISEQPSKEVVLIVSHGPNNDTDNKRWIQTLQSISVRLKERGGFNTVEGFTLRDDAPSAVRTRAVQALRDRVQEIDKSDQKALVVPLLLAPGGVEHKLALELRGLPYGLNTKTLLPDSRISEWIRSQVP